MEAGPHSQYFSRFLLQRVDPALVRTFILMTSQSVLLIWRVFLILVPYATALRNCANGQVNMYIIEIFCN